MHSERTVITLLNGMKIVQVLDNKSDMHGKYYLFNGCAYLHTDGVWRSSTRKGGYSGSRKECLTGYFDTPEQIVQALAAGLFPKLLIWEHQKDGSGI